jgi:hypothetical protein
MVRRITAGAKMAKVVGEQDNLEGFTVRTLMTMGQDLADTLSVIQRLVGQYDALAKERGMPTVAAIAARDV